MTPCTAAIFSARAVEIEMEMHAIDVAPFGGAQGDVPCSFACGYLRPILDSVDSLETVFTRGSV
jgi:hypothetical protein